MWACAGQLSRGTRLGEIRENRGAKGSKEEGGKKGRREGGKG